MITLVLIHNPFRPSERIVKHLPVDGRAVIEYFKPLSDELEHHYSLNGNLLDAEAVKTTIPREGDYLAACPVIHGGRGGGGGKNPLQIVGMLALTALSFGAAGLVGGMGSMGGMLAAGAVMYLGGSLLSPTTKPAKVDMPKVENSAWENGHSWDKMNNIAVQGGCVPQTYGVVRTAGQIIAQHVTTDGPKQYLNLLLCGGEGPVDSITEVKINDTLISNYPDVTVETRLGTNDQTVIPYFGDSFADQVLTYELEWNVWTTHTTEGNNGSGLEVTFSSPQGLYRIDNAGKVLNETVLVDIEYQLDGAGSWSSWGQVSLTGDANKAMRFSYRLDGITTGKYNVRCRINQRTTGDRYFTQVYWTQLSHILYDDFARPGKVLVGIKALATDKLSGSMPSITWKQTRASVYVKNPTSGLYEAKSAKNPAWLAYDLIHRCRYLKNINTGSSQYVVFGDPATSIDYTAFSAWAAWCDVVIDEEHSDKRCELNCLIDSATDLWEALQRVAAGGRGMVFLKGSQYSCIWDGTGNPVQMFCVGNTLKDSFSGDFLPLKDRADAIEVSFINEDKGYQRDTIIVYGDTFDTDTTVKNPTQVFLSGITNPRRAYREGRYRLRLNSLVRTCTWRADIDALAAQIGDVVKLQADVTRWGEGGRIVSGTTTIITLDKTLTLQPGSTYALLMRFPDDTMETRTVASVAETTYTNTLTVISAFSQTPEPLMVWAWGPTDTETKPFKLIGVSRDGDLRAQLTGIEYIPAVYTEDAVIPAVDYTLPAPSVTNLGVKSYFGVDGRAMIQVSWNPPRSSYGGAIILVDGKNAGRVGPDRTSFEYPASYGESHTVMVIGLDALGKYLGGLSTAYTPPSPSDPLVDPVPPDAPEITGLSYSVEVAPDGGASITISGTFTAGAGTLFVSVEAGEVASPVVYKDFGTFKNGTFRLPGLKANTAYSIKLTAYNKWGASTPDIDTITTTLTSDAPLKPGTPTLQLLFKNIRVKCFQNATKAYNLAGFRIYRNTTSDIGGASLVGFIACSGADDGVVFLDEGTGYGQTYYYWVTAISKNGFASVASDAAGPVTTLQVITEDLAAGAVTELKIASGAVSAAKTALAAINSTSGALNIDTVNTNQLVAGAVTALKIATDAVTSDKIYAGSITAVKIAAGAVCANHIAAGQICTSHLAAAGISADCVTTGVMSADRISTGTLSASVCLSACQGTIGGWTITGTSLYNGNVGMAVSTCPSFWAGSVTGGSAPFFVCSNGYVQANNLWINVCALTTAPVIAAKNTCGSGTYYPVGSFCTCSHVALEAVTTECYGLCAFASKSIAISATAVANYALNGLACTCVGVSGIACCCYGVTGGSVCFATHGLASCYYGVHGCALVNTGVWGAAACCYGVYGCAACCDGVYGSSCLYYGGRFNSCCLAAHGCASCVGGVYGYAGYQQGVYGYAVNANGVLGCSAGNQGVTGVACGCHAIYAYSWNWPAIYANYGIRSDSNVDVCNANLNVWGNITATCYYLWSRKETKYDYTDIGSVLPHLKRVPVEAFKKYSDKASAWSIGTYAEEFQAAFPWLGNGHYVPLDALVALNLKGIQEVDDRVDLLTKRVTELEGRLAA